MDTPIGRLPAPGALDISGLNASRTRASTQLLRVDVEGWTSELASIRQHYRQFGTELPPELNEELTALERRLNAGVEANR